MAKAAVVFHSVCGNVYQMASCLTEALRGCGIEADLFRVEDETFDEVSLRFEASREFREDIQKIPVIHSGEDVIGYDALFLGSPTYFGGGAAQMKRFMDSFCDLWAQARLAGMYFACFTSSGTASGGTQMCLQSMNVFAQHMGMRLIAVPCSLGGAPQPAYGLEHISGPTSQIRMNDVCRMAIREFAGYAADMIKK